MTVRELKRLIEHLDDDTRVVFHDVTHDRVAPVNDAELKPAIGEDAPRLVLTNRLQ